MRKSGLYIILILLFSISCSSRETPNSESESQQQKSQEPLSAGSIDRIEEDNGNIVRFRRDDQMLDNKKFEELDSDQKIAIRSARESGELVVFVGEKKERALIVNKDGLRKREKTASTKDAIIKATVAGYEKHEGLNTVVLSAGSRFWEAQYRDDTGSTDPFWSSVIKELEEQHPGNRVDQDPFLICIEYLKEHGKEVFWSVRFNDTHDYKMPVDELRGWKRRNARSFDKNGEPFLVGTTEEPPPFARPNALNYGNEAVRMKFVQVVTNGIRKFAGQHKLDGLEIDFMRHPVIFRSVAEGKVATDEQRKIITNMMTQIRGELRIVAKQRGRPIPLMIRIPDSVEFCKSIGIDLTTWMEEGLVDLIVGGDYYLLNSWKDFSKVCAKYDIPYFACLERRRIEQSVPNASSSASMSVPIIPEIWRGEALNAWEGGVSGIYVFNRPSANAPVLGLHLEDPIYLKRLPRSEIVRQTITTPHSTWTRPERWSPKY